VARSPLSRIDANLLVALEALLAEGNVGRAARRMGVSASAMSHTLARLRDLVGDPLLVRTGQRMSLTPRGVALLPALREGVTAFATALDAPPPLDLAAEQRTITIASVDYAQSLIVPGLVERLAREAPGIDLVIKPFADGSLRELVSGELQLVLCMQRSSTGLRSRRIHEEAFVSCVRAGHPVLGERLTVKRFAALEHVLISPRGRVAGAVDEALRARGIHRRVKVVVSTFMAAALLVARSDLVLTCATRSAEQARQWLGLQVVRPPLAIPSARLGMYWHARHEADAVATWLRDRISEIAGAAVPSGADVSPVVRRDAAGASPPSPTRGPAVP
jgi:DNA-binding transcriptional LysR family regulator